MPKNVVHRLQKIEGDLKTVVSLFEVGDKAKSNDKPETSKEQDSKQFPKISAPKRMETPSVFDKFREVPGKPQNPPPDSFKKTYSIIPRSPQGFHSGESVIGKKRKQKKPGSAPSSCSTLSTISESDYVSQQSSETDGPVEPGVLSKAKTSENLSSNWLDTSNAFPTYAVVMTPSKTLETAHEILAKNNFKENEAQNELLPHETVPFYRKPKGAERCGTDGVATHLAVDVKNGNPKNCDKIQIKAHISSTEVNGSHTNIPIKKDTSPEHIIQWSFPIKSGSFVTTKIYKPEEDPQMSESPIIIVESEEEKNAVQKNSSSELISLRINKFLSIKTGLSSESIPGEKEIKKRLEEKQKLPEKLTLGIKPNGASVGDEMDGKKTSWSILEKDKTQETDCGAQEWRYQKKKNGEENDDADMWVKEISKIIEKSNEKLEKMKVSKELALDIAKHLKNKYDEIRKSKEELTEKVKILQRSNERLNTEVKVTRELKKTEGLRNSRTRMEEDSETKDADEQNFWLKYKLSGTQRKQNSDVEKATKTEERGKDWFLECKRSREILMSKIQILAGERNDLLMKLNELQRQIHEIQSNKESLQENVHRLREEVKKQNENLQIKTETLNESNRELEMIRQNSTHLENQVKKLKQSLNDFDDIQQNLMKKTSEYEQRIKGDEEKIKKLQDENERLKGELENEKDGLLIKVKIIEDQQHTIKQLKEKAEDAKSLMKRNQSLERILNNERDEKLELQEAVERLKWRKQELKKKVRTLENDFLLAPQEVVKDLQKTQIVLHELENQVQVKQKEWELQLQSLIKEKEQACRVAEFATKKLRETTNEFQKQSDAYKGLQRIIAENFVVKKKKQGEGSNKMRNP